MTIRVGMHLMILSTALMTVTSSVTGRQQVLASAPRLAVTSQKMSRQKNVAESASKPDSCNQNMPDPITEVKVADTALFPLPTRDGCTIFVWGVENKIPGVIVLRRKGGKIEAVRFARIDWASPGAGQMAFTHDEKILIVPNEKSAIFLDVGRLISGQGNSILGSIGDSHFSSAAGVVITSDDKYAFVNQHDTAWVTVIDLNKARTSGFNAMAITGGIPTGPLSPGSVFSLDEKYLYITNWEPPREYNWRVACINSEHPADPPDHPEGALMVIDVQLAKSRPESSVIGAVRAGCDPARLTISPDGNTLFTAGRGDNKLRAFDVRPVRTGSAPALIGVVPVGPAPIDVAVIDGGKRVVVSNSNQYTGEIPRAGSYLTVIDVARIASGPRAVLGTIPVGADPRDMSVTKDGRTLLLANRQTGMLEIIDLKRLKLHPVKP